MNTDKEQKLQEGGKEAFLLKEETHAIIGCAFEVLNELGHAAGQDGEGNVTTNHRH